MKRFRPLSFDFDFTVSGFTLDIPDHWEESVKQAHRRERERLEQMFRWRFGEQGVEEKLRNYVDLGPKSISILAFHNEFFEQVRNSFVVSAYYPALTGACALGERILNHLVLALRDDFKSTPEYKRVYNKDSFDQWDVAIDTLEAWDVLLPVVVGEFRKLRNRRNDAIHFRPDVDHNDRPLALAAIHSLGSIISEQFSGFGPQPWFITGVPGEVYIKKEWENRPFIRRVYLPKCAPLGPCHEVQSVNPWKIRDDYPYENREITDDEFVSLRVSRKAG
jgi:hypothetical protein